MHEELMNAVCALVHRHVLIELRNTITVMLERDASGADLATQRNSTPPPTATETGASPTLTTAEPTVKASTRAAPGCSTDPGTISRRLRKQRQRQRQATAANGAANPDTPPAPSDWPELRQQFRETAAARGLVVSQIARQIGMKQGSLGAWVSRDWPAPGPGTVAKLRAWIEAEPVADATQAEPFTLSETEQAALRGHLSSAPIEIYANNSS